MRLLSEGPIPFEEERKRLLFGSIALLAALILVPFGAYHLAAGPVVEGVLNLTVAALFAVGVWRLRTMVDGGAVYRGTVVVLGLLFIFFGTLGDHGDRAVWALTLPAFALFITGVRFGTTVCLAVLAAWSALFVLPTSLTGAFDYSDGFAVRFIAAYGTILTLTVFIEQVRRKYSETMALHQMTLLRTNTDLMASEERLRDMAMVDPLTQVANRRAILDHLRSESAKADRHGNALAVAMLDLDHFKKINDAYGQGVGDRVLTECAGRIAFSLRLYDLVGRYGGEEFLLVLADPDPATVRSMMERVRHEIADRAFDIGDRRIRVTVSIGTAISSSRPIDASALVSRADRALYEAKSRGRNRVCSAAEMEEPSALSRSVG